MSIKFIILEVTIVRSNTCFEETITIFLILHVVSFEYHFTIFVNNSLSFNHTIFECSFVDHSIFPNISTKALPSSIFKAAFVLCSIIVFLCCSAFWIPISPISLIFHRFVFVAQSSISIKSWILKLSLIIGAIKKDIESLSSFSFTVYEIPHINFSLFEAAHSIAVRQVLFERSLISDSPVYNFVYCFIEVKV